MGQLEIFTKDPYDMKIRKPSKRNRILARSLNQAMPLQRNL